MEERDYQIVIETAYQLTHNANKWCSNRWREFAELVWAVDKLPPKTYQE